MKIREKSYIENKRRIERIKFFHVFFRFVFSFYHLLNFMCFSLLRSSLFYLKTHAVAKSE